MKKLILSTLLFLLFYTFGFSQENSTNGYHLSPNGTIRVFVVFAELTGTPDYYDCSST